MRVTELPIAGVLLLEADAPADERGHFERLWDRAALGELAQASLSHNHRRGTLRGLHYQAAPQAEGKTVACVGGAVFDVAVDLREGSPTRGRHVAVELSAENHRRLYLPPGVAHGFQTLVDDTVVLYFISVPYAAELQRGVRWDDPTLRIPWPLPVSVISERDRGLPLLEGRRTV